MLGKVEEVLEQITLPLDQKENLINLDTLSEDLVCQEEEVGRLSWEGFSEIGAPKWVVEGAKVGFNLEILESLVRWPRRGNKVFIEEEITFVDKEWEKLKRIGVLEEGYVKLISKMRCTSKKGPR